MQTHKDLKKFINDKKLISSMDHLIACDNHGWTDLRFTELDNRLTPESKYFLAINIQNKPKILYYNNLLDLRQEIDEKMIKVPHIKGYDEKNNRVFLHYQNDGIFRLGNISGSDKYLVQFEDCNLLDLVARKDYHLFLSLLKPDEKHVRIQTLLCELGVSLGFFVKIAINNTTTVIDMNPSLITSCLNFMDLELGNISEKKVENDIDLIDVLWCDPINKKIIMAFEVEFSQNYSPLFQRFSSLISATSYPLNLICVGDNYKNLRANYNRPIWKFIFSNYNFKYLSLDDLCEVLTLKRILGRKDYSLTILNNLGERLLPITPFI